MKSRSRGLIYGLVDPNTDQIRYCGKTVRRISERMAGHRADMKRGTNRHLYNWLNVLDRDGQSPKVVVFEEVDISGLDTKAQTVKMNDAEIRWIAKLRGDGWSLLNATIGGDGSHGRALPPEQRAKIAASNRGKTRSPESKARMRQAQLNKDPSCILRGKRHPHYGKPSPTKRAEVRKKLSQAWTPEKRKAWGEHTKLTQTGVPKKLTEKQILEIFENETLSFRALGRLYGVSKDTISQVKKGRFQRLTNNLNREGES